MITRFLWNGMDRKLRLFVLLVLASVVGGSIVATSSSGSIAALNARDCSRFVAS